MDNTATVEDQEQTVALVLTKLEAELLVEIAEYGVDCPEENQAAFESLLAKLRQL